MGFSLEKLRNIKSLFFEFKCKMKKKLLNLQSDQNVFKESTFLIRALTWGLITSGGLAFFWLAFASTEEIVIVEGKLEPVGNVKNIQLPFGGVVKEILVESGEEVSKDQVLLVLDNKAAKENLLSLKNQIKKKNAELELKKLEKVKSNEFYQKRSDTLQTKLRFKNDIVNRLKILLREGAISELNYLNKMLEKSQLEGEILENNINLDRQNLILSQDINSIEAELSEIKAKKIESEVLLEYKSIKAPVNGIVSDFKPTNVGFVAQSNFPIMKIVPFDNLEADIMIPSKKIGFVKVGMPVDISIDSFPSSDFAALKGTVNSIDSDVLDSNQYFLGDQLFFPASIKLNTQTLKLANGDELPLQVGMSLKANIKLRKVSFLKLLLGTFREKTQSLKSI